jgi:hypothetical protein
VADVRIRRYIGTSIAVPHPLLAGAGRICRPSRLASPVALPIHQKLNPLIASYFGFLFARYI